MKYLITIILSLSLISCSMIGGKKEEKDERSDVEKLITKKKRKNVPVNIKERTLSEESDGFFLGKEEVDPLGRQNVMWRAAIKTLDFIPINTADYDGGLIVTDWYSPETSNESVKINISFNSNEIKVSSISVKSFKRTCGANQNCKVSPMNKGFNEKIKSQILEEIKNIEINSKG